MNGASNRRRDADELIDRLMSKVELGPGGCWLWQGALSPGGYGRLGWVGVQSSQAHRAAYELLVGPIPDGLHIDHLCSVRRCVNPAHLEAVTQTENNHRTARAECPNGHPLTPENTFNTRNSCRVCTNDRRRSEAAKRGRRNRRRGHEAERAVVRWLREHGYPDAITTRAKLGHDGASAPGDIDFAPGVALEVKDVARSAWPAWQRQALAQAGPDRIACVVRRTRGKPDVGEWECRWNWQTMTASRWERSTFDEFMRHLEQEDV